MKIERISNDNSNLNSELAEQKVYLVFLDVIEVVDLKDSNVQPFISLGSYIESFAVGEENIYATLSMKE